MTFFYLNPPPPKKTYPLTKAYSLASLSLLLIKALASGSDNQFPLVSDNELVPEIPARKDKDDAMMVQDKKPGPGREIDGD